MNSVIKELLQTIGSSERPSYDAPPHEYVYKKYLEYIETGKYPYLDDVVKFIKEELPELDYNSTANLKTLVYNCSQHNQDVIKNREIEKLKTDGWNLLTEEALTDAISKGYYIKLFSKSETILGYSRKERILRPVRTTDNIIFLMPPRATRKGYNATQFFYKEISMYKYCDKNGNPIEEEIQKDNKEVENQTSFLELLAQQSL